MRECGVGVRALLADQADGAGGVAKVEPGHEIGVRVVVDDGRVLVRPGNRVDVELTIRPVEAEVLPEAGGLDQDLGSYFTHQVEIALHVGIPPDGVRDVGVDVVLGGTGLEVGRRLLTGESAPREEGALLAHNLRSFPGPVQHAVPMAQQISGDSRLRVAQKRQDVDLGVPKVVSVVGVPGHPLGADPRVLGPPRRLGHLEQVPADGLLPTDLVGPALDPDVGPVPEQIELLPLLLEEGVESVAQGSVESAAAPVDQLARRDAPGTLVRRELGDPDWTAGRSVRGHEDLPAVLIDGPLDPIGARRVDDVVHTHRERHLAVRGAIAEQNAAVVSLTHLS